MPRRAQERASLVRNLPVAIDVELAADFLEHLWLDLKLEAPQDGTQLPVADVPMGTGRVALVPCRLERNGPMCSGYGREAPAGVAIGSLEAPTLTFHALALITVEATLMLPPLDTEVVTCLAGALPTPVLVFISGRLGANTPYFFVLNSSSC